jgi:hypothetical protein
VGLTPKKTKESFMSLTLELDFTGHTPVGVGLGFLTTGMHEATVLEFRHYEESNRLYCYLMTEGIRHRESFSLSEKAMPFLMAFLISAGIPEEKLAGKVKFPFERLVGRPVFFNYTAPTMGTDGSPIDGSYPDYRFLPRAYYEQMALPTMTASADTGDFEVESSEKTNGVPTKPATPEAAGDEDFSFLVD